MRISDWSSDVCSSDLLPLAHHAHPLVVHDEHLDRQIVLRDARKLLDVHQDRGLAGNVDDEGVGMRALHAQRRGHAVAHGAEAAGGHPVVRLLELEILRRPHLVLRSEEHTSELKSLMRISYAVFCLKNTTTTSE